VAAAGLAKVKTQVLVAELAPTTAFSSVNMARGVLTARQCAPFQCRTKTLLSVPMPESQASRLPTLSMTVTGPLNVRTCDQADCRVTDPDDATATAVAAVSAAKPKHNAALTAHQCMDRTAIAAPAVSSACADQHLSGPRYRLAAPRPVVQTASPLILIPR